jgi:hypothetical protein
MSGHGSNGERGRGLMTASQYFTVAGPMLFTVAAGGLVTMIVGVACGLHLLRRVVRVLETLEETARRDVRGNRRGVGTKRR